MSSLMKQSLLKRVAIVLPVTLVGLFASANAYGNVILDGFLTNPSFEANPDGTSCPTGWVCGGANSATSYVVTGAQYVAGSDGLASGIVPNGVAAGTIPAGIEGSGTLTQILTMTYAPNTIYQINLWVGTPLTELDNSTATKGGMGTITASFMGAGGVALQDSLNNTVGVTTIASAPDQNPQGSHDNLPNAPDRGQWQLYQLIFDDSVVTNVNLAATQIQFQILADSTQSPQDSGNDRIANFDIASVPEPASFALLGLGLVGLGIARKKLRS